MRNAEKFAKVYPSLHLANPIPRRRRVRRREREGIDLSFPLFRAGEGGERKEGGWRTVGGGTKGQWSSVPAAAFVLDPKIFSFFAPFSPSWEGPLFLCRKEQKFLSAPSSTSSLPVPSLFPRLRPPPGGRQGAKIG